MLNARNVQLYPTIVVTGMSSYSTVKYVPEMEMFCKEMCQTQNKRKRCDGAEAWKRVFVNSKIIPVKPLGIPLYGRCLQSLPTSKLFPLLFVPELEVQSIYCCLHFKYLGVAADEFCTNSPTGRGGRVCVHSSYNSNSKLWLLKCSLFFAIFEYLLKNCSLCLYSPVLSSV